MPQTVFDGTLWSELRRPEEMLVEILLVKTRLRRFLLERTTLAVGLQMMDSFLTEKLSAICSCSETLPETENKGSG